EAQALRAPAWPGSLDDVEGVALCLHRIMVVKHLTAATLTDVVFAVGEGELQPSGFVNSVGQNVPTRNQPPMRWTSARKVVASATLASRLKTLFSLLAAITPIKNRGSRMWVMTIADCIHISCLRPGGGISSPA